jgi:cyanophycinase
MKKYILTGLLVFQAISLVLAQGPVKKNVAPVIINPPIKILDTTTRHGPAKGALLIIGGKVGSTRSIWDKFTELAGGKEHAVIVVVTTAAGDSAAFDQADVDIVKKETGIKHVTLLHTADLKTANTEKFIEPLTKATGVYFVGGRQWRIADSYLNTLTHKAFFDVLERGGVIAGSSAGASIQGSFLWRGDTRGPQILIGDHTQGLGFLKNSAIDQHLLKRNRQFDLVGLIQKTPELIGIGLDEATAIVVKRDTLQVIGQSLVAIYDYNTIVGTGEKHVVNNDEVYTNANGFFSSCTMGKNMILIKERSSKSLASLLH